MFDTSHNTLPPNWSWVKLGDVVENFKRGPFGSAIKKSFFVPEGYKVYEQKNAIYNSIELGNYFIDEKKFQELQGFEVGPGDFIVSCSGTIGKIYRLPPNSSKGIINQALLRIRLNEKKIFEKYFLELFKSYGFQKKMLVETRGSAMLNIAGVKELKQIPIPLPPLPEQKKIVDKIEELFSGLDNGIASLKKAKEQIRLYRQSVLASAFSGKLTQSAQHQAHSELPEGWKWVKLGEIISPSKARFEPLQNDNVKYIGLEHIEKGTGIILSYADSNTVRSTKSVFKKGNLLYGKLRPYLNKIAIAEFDGVCSTDILVFENQEKLSNRFLKYRLLCEDYVNYAQKNMKGVQHPRINFKSISEFEISLPPHTIQTQIVEEIEKRFSEADNLEKAIDESLAKAETLRQSILKQAFEGKLV